MTADECIEMLKECQKNDVKLMVAYRLHFEAANMKAVDIIMSGKIGRPLLFSSVFSQTVKGPDIRLNKETGGGCLYDIGVYCINAARYLFREEPLRVTAFTTNAGDPKKFDEVDGLTGVMMEFSGGKIANFVCTFTGFSTSSYTVIGTEGQLKLEPAYSYSTNKTLSVYTSKNEKTNFEVHEFEVSDQFGPELLRFTESILNDTEAEPSGMEGLADISIIAAIYKSATENRTINLGQIFSSDNPTLEKHVTMPAIKSY
jgi:glucose-fructose oxidoreductase